MDIYGYFDSAEQSEPAYDPGVTAPCPACGKPVTSEGVRTQSFLVPGDYRCYFIRYHIACADDPKVEEAVGAMVDKRAGTADALNTVNGTTGEEIIARIAAAAERDHE